MWLPPWCQSALLVLLGLTAAGWLGAGLVYAAGVRRIRGLGSVRPLPDEELPLLTIVVAARNEGDRVGAAVRTLLAQEYPRLEVIAVDDRSEDGTGAILDAAAAEDPRLVVRHVADLPEGWLGKCHALARGAAEASGEWLLFTDGDVSLAPDAARRAVTLARELRADHLAVAADLEVHSLAEAVFLAFFVFVFNLSQRPWDAPDPRSDAHIGIGAFNLVRRDAYAHSGGHERLRMELLDDLALGWIVKRSGGSSHFGAHDGRVRARWQVGLQGLIRGVEKNAFPSLGYSVTRTAGGVALQILVCLIPLLGLVVGIAAGSSIALALSLLAWSGVFLVYAVNERVAGTSLWLAVTMPIGSLLFGYAILASMVITLRAGGVVWRGTFYDLERLKAGRVR